MIVENDGGDGVELGRVVKGGGWQGRVTSLLSAEQSG